MIRNQLFVKSSEDMSELADASVDSLITDPPAGISFMGKSWDADKGGRDQWIAWLEKVMREAYRVLKPGAHGFVWALPRTSHWTATALENAGFEVRDVVCHLFGSGFPKSLDVSKAIDKAAGAERKVVGIKPGHENFVGRDNMRSFRESGVMAQEGGFSRPWMHDPEKVEAAHYATAAATEEAKRWEGWGTALKPAAEHWILIRKPIREKNVAANVLRYGTGAMNIDASRIEVNGEQINTPQSNSDNREGSVSHALLVSKSTDPERFKQAQRESIERTMTLGRWPANVVLSHNEDCVQIGTRIVGSGETERPGGERPGGFYDVGSENGDTRPAGPMYGEEEVPVYRCSSGCAVAELDRQSGELQSGYKDPAKAYGGPSWTSKYGDAAAYTFADSGGASRFFWVAKPSTAEKNANIGDQLPIRTKGASDGAKGDNTLKGPTNALRPDKATRARNNHPTVKPVALMQYLIRLITPPGGIVLDCFAGSGTTLVAAESLALGWIGYEQNPEYAAIAEARLSQRSLFGMEETA